MRRGLILLAWLCIMFGAGPATAQNIVEHLITPGPLSSAHAELESQCSSCHASFQRSAETSRCIDCHDEIGRDIARRVKFHGRYGQARTRTCRTCHSEHQGRSFQMIRPVGNSFNHDLTDYPLNGGHRGVSCTGCHGNGNDFRGTTTSCATCHRDDEPHRGRLGRQCQDCHLVAAWSSLRPFDHRAQTGFLLAGSHQRASCTSCHQDERWEGLGTACIDCHRQDDSHRGSRGTNCASCHSATSWPAVTFNHDRTGFSLVGGHAAASCASCHGAGNSNRNPSVSCNSCHEQDDVHEGGNGVECQDCHTPRNWTQVRFDHDNMTEFPLRGRHRQTACESCHVQAPLVAAPPVTCFGCHEVDDEHEGRNGPDCERCHVESSWDEVTFDHDTMTEFPLLGAHSATACESCHTAPSQELALERECASCHAQDDVHEANLGSNCARCHTNTDWVTNVRFDHEFTSFPLLGKHAEAECSACHEDQSYTASGSSCADCHQDDHHAGTLGTPANCQSCHNTLDWAAWSFDHDRQTRFPLTGQHEFMICSACHSRPGDPAQLAGECSDCHRRDDQHRGEFGADCARCHVTSSFTDIILPD